MNLIAMNCPQCGAKLEIAKVMMFCPYCGSKITIVTQNEGIPPSNDLQLGLYYLLMEQYQQADDCFSRLLEKIPTSNLAWFWRAIIANIYYLDDTTAIRYWHQSAISNDDVIALLVQVFSKPDNPVIDKLIWGSLHLAEATGDWDIFNAIMEVGLKLGKQDVVIRVYMNHATSWNTKECPTEIYDYVLRLDASKHDEVIEQCLMDADYEISTNEPNKEKAESYLNYVKKIDPNGEKLVNDYWLRRKKYEENLRLAKEGKLKHNF